MMEELLLRFLTVSSESEVLEYKKAGIQYDRDKLGRYFSALSNEANLKGLPSAWMLLGVANDKTITGTSISDSQINEYKHEVASHTSPKLSFTQITRVTVGGKDVLILEIPAAPNGIPVAWKGHYYGRDGESLAGLDIAELERIRKQGRVFDWSAQIVHTASIDDLSQEAIADARLKYKEKNPKLADEIEEWDDRTFLNKAKITINGEITNAAILLLGKPESEHFINPAVAKISWILKDSNGIEKDYEHFSCPFFLAVDEVFGKIRNIKYRYIKEETLFPEEVSQFDPFIIREALNNCIAHQDYTMGGKINVVEREDGVLTFSNMGDFIPKSLENVIESDAPEPKYRNPFLASAMVNLNMIDTIGSGIKRMFVIQKDKYFPLPEYDLKDNKVSVTITGKVIDIDYARKLARMPDLSLLEIMYLDKVTKGKELKKHEANILKSKGLIEGRKPNYHISSKVARVTGEKKKYIKQRGIDDEYCKKMILDYLDKFGEGQRSDFESLLLDKLPDVLDIDQKKNKVKNILQSMRRKGVIETEGKTWEMSKK